MVSDIGYINARLRAMRSYLLKKENYEELLRRDSFNSLFLYLQSLPSYSDDMREAQARKGQTKEAVDEALTNNLIRNFRKIIDFCGGRPRELILLILHRWDIYNLKVILRWIFSGSRQEGILDSTLPLGEWDEAMLDALSEQDSIDEIAGVLARKESVWSKGVSSILRHSEEDATLGDIENALDLFYFSHCVDDLDEEKDDDKQVLGFIRLEIDFKNILHVISSIEKSAPINESCIIPSGRISESFILTVSQSRNNDDALNTLADSYYKEILAEAATWYSINKTIVSVEKFFKKQLFLAGIDLYRKSALNIGVGIGYLLMKEVEIINLRTLAKGLYYGIDPYVLFLNGELILSYV